MCDQTHRSIDRSITVHVDRYFGPSCALLSYRNAVDLHYCISHIYQWSQCVGSTSATNGSFLFEKRGVCRYSVAYITSNASSFRKYYISIQSLRVVRTVWKGKQALSPLDLYGNLPRIVYLSELRVVRLLIRFACCFVQRMHPRKRLDSDTILARIQIIWRLGKSCIIVVSCHRMDGC